MPGALRAKIQQLLAQLSPRFEPRTPDEFHAFSLRPTITAPEELKEARDVVSNVSTTTLSPRRAFSTPCKANDLRRTDSRVPPPPQNGSPYLLSSVSTTTVTTALSVEPSFSVVGDYDSHRIHQYLTSLASDLLPRTCASEVQSFSSWRPEANAYAGELLRLEGRGDNISGDCCRCLEILNNGLGLRCEDCHYQGLLCMRCCLDIHSCHPLHRIQRWTGHHFKPETLRFLGLRLNLGHAHGEKCPNPVHFESFVVLDVTGIHEVRTRFCACESGTARYVQLLRQRWFPATSTNPRIAATFRLLEQFSYLSALSTVTATDFYQTLVRLTNKSGLDPPADHLAAFRLMAQEWQYLDAINRSGLYSQTGGAPTALGILDCPACPSEGRTLLLESWVNRLWRAVNLQGTKDSNATTTHHNDAEHRTESDLRELQGACGRSVEAKRPPGVTIVSCSHGFKRARRACEVPSRRRHVNVQSPSAQSLPSATYDARPTESKQPVSKPDELYEPSSRTTLADAERRREDVESQEMFESLLGTWNRGRVMTLPANLLLRVQHALPLRNRNVAAFRYLTRSIPARYTRLWSGQVTDWESDPTKISDPQEMRYSHLSEEAIRAELAEEDTLAYYRSQSSLPRDGLTLNQAILLGLDFEKEQRQLRAEFAALESDENDSFRQGSLLEQQHSLQRRIEAWYDKVEDLIPGVAWLRGHTAYDTHSTPSQDLRLLLPSAICSNSTLSDMILRREWRLREAQAYDALADLRGHLEVVAYLRAHGSHSVNFEGQRNSSDIVVSVIQADICIVVSRYREAYNALCSLAAALHRTGWHGPLATLLDDDIRYIGARDKSDQRPASWIWNLGGTAWVRPQDVLDVHQNRDLYQALRVAWCRARARAAKSTSECESLVAELRRIAAHHAEQVVWWEMQVNRNFIDHPDYCEGANAYAYREASLFRSMRDQCDVLWRAVWSLMGMGDARGYAALPGLCELSRSLMSPTLASEGSVEDSIGGQRGKEAEAKGL
ncbi:hypothetical protein BD309DRAFT_906317 [Dichomitus squalens]|nr:hypothetical protein BD309DRAFT_906317 [Dichomitus squalens]